MLKTERQEEQVVFDTSFYAKVEEIRRGIMKILQTPLPNSYMAAKEEEQQMTTKRKYKKGKKERKDNGVKEMAKGAKRKRKLALNCRGESSLPIVARPLFRFIRHET